jgi:hypothetical protein
MTIVSCHACGWEQGSTSIRPDELYCGEGQMRAIIHWAGDEPTAKEVLAVKKIVFAFQSHSIPELLALFAESPTRELGIFFNPIAKQLSLQARAVGLRVELEPVE